MANVLHCVQHTPIMGSQSGSRPNRYFGEWRVVMDALTTFPEMLQAARAVARTGDQRPVPRLGQPLRFNTPVRIGNTDVKVDRTPLALDFEVRELLDDGKTWIVQVLWRAPEPGQDEEHYRVGRAPWNRLPYYWTEYLSIQVPITTALPISSQGTGPARRLANQPGPLSTAAGEEIEIRTREEQIVVYCAQFNTLDPKLHTRLNDKFENTTNSETWRVRRSFNRSINRRYARFLRAELSQFPENYLGREYWRAQVRVAAKNEIWREEVANRGTLYVRLGSPDSVEVNRDINGVLRPINLTRLGTPDVNNEARPIRLSYIVGDEKDYNSMGIF